MSRHLERIRGVKCHPDQIIITSGLQQSLDYICQFLGNTKRCVLMEDPIYPKVREIFRKNHYPIITADIDDKGLELT
ncbi:MAG: aminotransferase class I/II-fold pyridoxal phosphate-dependent enzyme [Streptococcus lutetiensis]|nr:aminotransferase class I/II-fold pyridoxal phosphate-dependent enzyme [Streptococcus lutetiensis]